MKRIKADECPHFKDVRPDILEQAGAACAECGASAPNRVCMSCAHVGCCESARGHALAHSRSSGHPLIRELPISERSFTWCYGCNAYLT